MDLAELDMYTVQWVTNNTRKKSCQILNTSSSYGFIFNYKKGLLYVSAHWVFRTSHRDARILRPGSMNVTHPTIPACHSQGLSYTRLFLVRSKNTLEGKTNLVL